MSKEEWYLARTHALATTKPGSRVDAEKGLMEFSRKARRPMTKRELAERRRMEAEKIKAAFGASEGVGGRKRGGIRRWTRDADGVVRDENGEVVEGY